jgi:hypothetical protein
MSQIEWISVEDELPKDMNEKVIAVGYRDYMSGGENLRMQRCFMATFVRPKEVAVEDFLDSDSDMYEGDWDEKNDIEWVKSGWFESFENHSDFSGYECVDFTITHFARITNLPKCPELKIEGGNNDRH